MFPTPDKILKAREGKLDETPLPLLLHALSSEERDGTLELRMRQLEKRIEFEDGHPVACQSNLLHETLGKSLVEKGKLAEGEYQKLLGEAASTGQQFSSLMVTKQLISPFELYKFLQANLAHKILDAFRWSGATYRWVGEVDDDNTRVKMNPAQLILTGVSNFTPFEVVQSQLSFDAAQTFALTPHGSSEAERLKLNARDTKLFLAFRNRPTFVQACEASGLDAEQVYRRLYAFTVLGYVDRAEDVQAAPVAPAPVVIPVVQAPAVQEVSDEDRNALMTAFLAHRAQDPWSLLELTEAATTQQQRKAFLDKADRFSPRKYAAPELREKAEALLAALAKAFATLAEPELAELWKKRRAAAKEKTDAAQKKNTAAEQFRIRTDLLDASSQLAEAKKRLAAGNHKGALEYFEFACDIEPRPLHRAFRAWSRYLWMPNANGRLSLTELADASREDPNCEEAWYFAAEIHKARQEFADAERCYRGAYKANPQQRKYVELIQEAGKKVKRG